MVRSQKVLCVYNSEIPNVNSFNLNHIIPYLYRLSFGGRVCVCVCVMPKCILEANNGL